MGNQSFFGKGSRSHSGTVSLPNIKDFDRMKKLKCQSHPMIRSKERPHSNLLQEPQEDYPLV